MNNLSKIYTFDGFRLDAGKFALYHNDRLVKNVDKKTLQILAVLLKNPQHLTTYEEIIEEVWQDNPLGMTSNNIGQYISKLRKLFSEYSLEINYIETFKGRGYSFTGDVSLSEIEMSQPPNQNSYASINDVDVIKENVEKAEDKNFSHLKIFLISAVVITIFLIIFWSWNRLSKNDEEDIRRVVKESQLYESLVLYTNPAELTESNLDKYWMTNLDVASNHDRHRIKESVNKMIKEGRRYGSETKCEQFEFQSVELNQDKNFAVVKTLEKWFIAVYSAEGALQQNKYVGPYFVSYTLRKVDGNWLIEKSNTGRMVRPIPRLENIEPISEIKAGQQFFVRITGKDFEAENIYLEVFGAGCPENNPCKVPNSALRENSKLTESILDNVPLTLASGEFKIVARNSDSQASNPVYIKVP